MGFVGCILILIDAHRNFQATFDLDEKRTGQGADWFHQFGTVEGGDLMAKGNARLLEPSDSFGKGYHGWATFGLVAGSGKRYDDDGTPSRGLIKPIM